MMELADEPTTLMFHAEVVPPITASVGDEVQRSAPPAAPAGPLQEYSTFLASRPPAFETYAIEEIISLSTRAPRLPLHIVHLSAMEAIPVLRKARANGVPITAETCFHYLSLVAEEICDGDTRYKCCPPIRSQANQDRLWLELEQHATDGVIKTVVSDHSPCTPNLKLLPPHIAGHNVSVGSSVASSLIATPSVASDVSDEECDDENPDENPDEGNFFAAWGGISSVGLGLPILWTELSQRRKLDAVTSKDNSEETSRALQDIVQWCCANTARQVGLEQQKGDLAVGFDADVCVFDDAVAWVVESSTMLFRHKCSPYQGRILRGMVRETWLRGERVFSRCEGFSPLGPTGKLLLQRRTC
jgi:allantoinase